MIPLKRAPLLTFSTTFVLGLLAVVIIILLSLPELNAATRLAASVLSVFLVIVLLLRDRTAQQKSEQELERLGALVNSSEDAIISKTLDGTILAWNRGAERLFGYSADEVVGQSVRIIYPPERLDEFEHILERLRRGESSDMIDTIRVAKDGRPIDVSISESLIRDAQGHPIGVSKIVRDTTERKRAEQAAHFLAEVSEVLASSLDYETTLASIARLAVPRMADWCAVHVKREDGTIQQLVLTHVDPAKVELARELHRRYLQDPNVPYSVSHVIRTGKPEIAPPFAGEPTASAHDPPAFNIPPDPQLKSLLVVPLMAPAEVLGAITFVSAGSGRVYGPADLALAQDLAHRAALAVDNARLYHKAQSLNEELDQRVAQRTLELANSNRNLETEIAEHQRTNEQLRLLAAHLQSAREEERIRIARELHDELGTLMTAIKMDLAFLNKQITGSSPPKSPETLHEEIRATTELVDGAIRTVHQIVVELRPAVLDHLGLRAALEWQVQDFQTRTSIECQFRSDLDSAHLDPERSTAIFRILQETLTNVARHAHATHVDASLKEQDGHLILEVRDNGLGISEEQITNTNRFGLLGMRERAQIFGGDVVIHGAPGQGTTVTVRIPV